MRCVAKIPMALRRVTTCCFMIAALCPGRWLELHHIVGGPGRKDLPDGSNWIALCARCHHAVHNRLQEYGELPKGSVLSAKEEEDGPVDEAKLAALKHRRSLPYEREPIPERFLLDRRRRGGDPWP
jgi:hypothetical protein